MFLGFKVCAAFNKAIPPPGTIPSFIAALVAHIASSTLSLFSFSSTSELAPTFTIATFPASLANLFSSDTIKLGLVSFCNLDFKLAISYSDLRAGQRFIRMAVS